MYDRAEVALAAVRPLRVLVIDDNRDAADTLTILARLWGHDARACYAGEAGVREARAWHPDCLFVDIGLPGLDGYQVAERVRRDPALRRAVLVALTAYSGEECARQVLEAGFDLHLVKPAAPDDVQRLLAAIRQGREALCIG